MKFGSLGEFDENVSGENNIPTAKNVMAAKNRVVHPIFLYLTIISLFVIAV